MRGAWLVVLLVGFAARAQAPGEPEDPAPVPIQMPPPPSPSPGAKPPPPAPSGKASSPAPSGKTPPLSLMPRLTPRTTAGRSARCEACHQTSGFETGRFQHDKTGFPLLGAHARTRCGSCHPTDYERQLPRTCVGCHQDPHAGDLGAFCEGCHDETSWESRFSADAHRRTAFPLVGRHAALACEECHGQFRERRFTRVGVDCVQCHQDAYDRTRGTDVDHVRLNMGPICRQCHNGLRWAPARYPQHDLCLDLSGGEHAGLPCRSCHVTLPPTFTGLCRTQTTACTGCHEHACSVSDGQHTNVAGYECRDRKCYECHRIDVTR